MRAQDQDRTRGNERSRTPVPRTRAAGREVPPAGLMAQQGSVGNAVVLQMLRGAGYPWASGTGGADSTGEQDAPHVQRSAVHDVLRGPGRPLDGALRAEMESRLGADFSDVRVHDESAARASAAEIGAHAYTSGNHIVLGSGGVDRHTLAHELTHVIQQRRGRVSGQDNGAGLRVSDPSDRFEREAESTASRVMAAPVPTVPASPEPAGSAVSDARQSGAPVQRAVPATGGTPVIQRKSRFSSIAPQERNAQLPVHSLHTAFEKYFREVGLSEQYFFAGLGGLVRAEDYRSGFHRAGAVTAEIDPASHRKADGSNRDNGVIGPYGHFGVMERAIFGRQNLGNTYDGGHLVEHTLMEARDADVHGNIAPQENKNFNQGLMRGWERIAEELVLAGKAFHYKVELTYSSDTYRRTGAQLVAAGIIPDPVYRALAGEEYPADPTRTLADLLDKETVSFQRWVPTQWVGKVTEPSGAALPTLTLTKGAHFRNLHGSQADAMNGVVDPTALAPVTNPGVPGLRRQNSGTLGGFIETAAVTNTGLLSVGGAPSVSAYMYQPEPQDLADQPTATTTPAGAAPAQLPASNIVVNALPHQLSLAGLYQDLMSIETKKRKRPGGELTNENKAAGTIDQEAKNASTGFRTLRTLFGKAEDGKKLVLAIRGHDANTTFGHGAFIDAISRANLNKAFYRTLTQLGYDPNLVA
ncbi:eCIS core domain-containing protein [Streptomyces sp. Wh19]|uniref:eCIS core domain-containing protein n=1 Tax=Streptomyces sp. Wh19 TaxID=3076629 RepID=UPI003FA3AF27